MSARAARLAEHAERTAAAWPAPTAEQKARVRDLLAPVGPAPVPTRRADTSTRPPNRKDGRAAA